MKARGLTTWCLGMELLKRRPYALDLLTKTAGLGPTLHHLVLVSLKRSGTPSYAFTLTRVDCPLFRFCKLISILISCLPEHATD